MCVPIVVATTIATTTTDSVTPSKQGRPKDVNLPQKSIETHQ